MSDPVLTFTPQVKEFVNKAMQNKTGVAANLLSLVPLPAGAEPTKHDLSEFYQLRIACVRGTAERPVTAFGLKKEDTGRVCDAVLVTAAEQMRKGSVAIDDPTHLLAPYHVSQQIRGYTAVDGKPVDVAILGARIASLVNRDDQSAEDAVKRLNLRQLFPQMMPKAAPANQPVTLLSFKGGAKDAGFTAQAAVALLFNGGTNPEGDTAAAAAVLIIEKGANCNRLGTDRTRSDCQQYGASMGNRYSDAVFRR